jgi:hypothetical protein
MRDFQITSIDDEPVLPPTAVERTLAAMNGRWAGDNGRLNQARAFIKRAKRSDAKRRAEKASRKRNR